MLNVLFIAYNFPPCTNIGGSLRSEKFVKYLPNYDWHARILSLDEGVPMHSEQFPCVLRIPSLTPWQRPYQLTPYGWLLPLHRAGVRVLQRGHFDIIYVSCPPFLPAYTALKLKKLSGLPLVVDFRDAWSLDPYMEGSLLKKLFYSRIFPVVEKMVIAGADRFIVNCASAHNAYLKKYNFLEDRIKIIPNGYDEDDFTGYRPAKTDGEMSLLYVGRFGIGGRNPGLLLKSFKQALSDCPNMRLRIIGAPSSTVQKLCHDYHIDGKVELIGEVSHAKAVQSLARCSVLILYQEHSRANITAIAGKTYEYLRSGKPIIAVAPPGDNIEIVKQYAGCCKAVVCHDPAYITRAIRAMYSDWKNGLLPHWSSPKMDYFRRFNRDALTAQLVSLFQMELNRK